MSETYVVTIGSDGRSRRVVERHPIPHTALALALARQQYEELSARALNDTIKDMKHEQHRRAGTLAALGGWDPESTQRRGA